MIEVLRTDVPVLLSRPEMRVAQLDIQAVVFGGFTAGVDGGAIEGWSRRALVAPDDPPRALRVIDETRSHDDNREKHV